MSTIFKLAAIGAVSFAALATSAQAQSRYGDIMAYEGVGGCDPAACVVETKVESSRYGSVQPAVGAAPVMVDCSLFGNAPCGPQMVAPQVAPQVVAQPTTVYTQQVQTYVADTVNCPAGTTMQSDGTCMQTAQAAPIYPRSSSSYSSSTTMTADCPAGTTMQSDGTCLQSSTPTAPIYPPVTQPYEPAPCPMGTTMQADGTCAQTATVYSGDAVPGYGSSTTYGADAYRPIRK